MKGVSICVSVALSITSLAIGQSSLDVRQAEQGVTLSWLPFQARSDVGLPVSSRYQAFESEDLRKWQPLGDSLSVSADDLPRRLSLQLDPQASTSRYYRVGIEEQDLRYLAQDGAEVFGFGQAFNEALAELGEIDVPTFRKLYPTPEYLASVGAEPQRAAFWDLLQESKMRVGEAEIALLERNGFVVTQRNQYKTMVDFYYDLW